jgi:hypothetical protein
MASDRLEAFTIHNASAHFERFLAGLFFFPSFKQLTVEFQEMFVPYLAVTSIAGKVAFYSLIPDLELHVGSVAKAQKKGRPKKEMLYLDGKISPEEALRRDCSEEEEENRTSINYLWRPIYFISYSYNWHSYKAVMAGSGDLPYVHLISRPYDYF